MDASELQTIFATTPDRTQWVEYTVRIHCTGETTKPYDLSANLAWRSAGNVRAVAAVRGSFTSEAAAKSAVNSVATQYGREVVKGTREIIKVLGEKYNYPQGRSTYLLEKPVV